MSFYLCSVEGCNSKYKTDKKWVLHMKTKHNMEDVQLPDKIEINKNIKTRTNNNIIKDVKMQQLRLYAIEKKRIEEEAKKIAGEKMKEEYADKYSDMMKKELELKEQELELKEQEILMRDSMINNEDNKCIVCFDREINACPSSCGHLHFCDVCLNYLQINNKKCPSCRGPIDSITNVFKV